MTSFYSDDELKQLGIKKIGDNVKISRFARIYGGEHLEIGNNVRIDDFCIISGNVKIGNHVHISAAVLLFGGNSGIELCDFTGLSSRTAVYAESDDYSGEAMTTPAVPNEYRNILSGKIILEKHVLVGTGCTILPGVTIKEGTSVGSMSLINKSLDEWGMYLGIPCRRIRDRSKKILELEENFKKSIEESK